MRKIFLMIAAVALTLVGCGEEIVPGGKLNDNVALDLSYEGIFPSTGGQLAVTVASTAHWALIGESDWAIPQSRYGADGETVIFDILANESEHEVKTEFTFKVGRAEKMITITTAGSTGGGGTPAYTFRLTEPTTAAAVTIANNAGGYAVLMELDGLRFQDIHAEFDYKAGGEDWIRFDGTGQVGDETQVYFVIDDNEGLVDRKVEIILYPTSKTIDPLAPPVTVILTQSPPPIFEVTLVDAKAGELVVGLEGGDVVVEVETNALVGPTISPGPADFPAWVQQNSQIVGTKRVYTYTIAAFNDPPKNKRTFTFTMTPPEGYGTEPVEVKIVQQEMPLIGVAADMANNWARISYEGNNFSKLNFRRDHSDFTIEFLVNIKAVPTGSWGFFGIEGVSLLRIGDASTNRRLVEFCFRPRWNVNVGDNYDGNSISSGFNSEKKIAAVSGGNTTYSTMSMNANQWTHWAVVYDIERISGDSPPFDGSTYPTTLSNLTITAYKNGVKAGSWTSPEASTTGGKYFVPDFSKFVATEQGNSGLSNAWNIYLNAAYNNQGRNANALYSELRIWNKALDIATLHATDPERIYGVDPASDGLVAYWKLNEGSGNVFDDSTANNYNIMANNAPVWTAVTLPSVTYVE